MCDSPSVVKSAITASQPLTVLIDLGMVIFHPLLHLWRIFIYFFARYLHQWSPSWGWQWMFECWVYTYVSFYVLSFTVLYPLGAVFMIIPPYILQFGFFIDYFGLFGLIWLSSRVQFLYTLSEVSTRSCLSQVLCLNRHIGQDFTSACTYAFPYDHSILTLGTNPFHGITEPSCCFQKWYYVNGTTSHASFIKLF